MRFILLSIVLGFLGCKPSALYRNEVRVPDAWTYNDPIAFNFQIEDTTRFYDISLDVTHSEEYKYQNLYVMLHTTFPDGNKAEDRVSLDLRLNNGVSQGSCRSKVCSVPFLLQENVRFGQTGNYTIEVYQHSRMDTLFGVNKLELAILEQKEKS